MIFATGEIKEGLFIEGVFKLEGGELEVKKYMKLHKIKTYDMDSTSNSKQPQIF